MEVIFYNANRLYTNSFLITYLGSCYCWSADSLDDCVKSHFFSLILGKLEFSFSARFCRFIRFLPALSVVVMCVLFPFFRSFDQKTILVFFCYYSSFLFFSLSFFANSVFVYRPKGIAPISRVCYTLIEKEKFLAAFSFGL